MDSTVPWDAVQVVIPLLAVISGYFPKVSTKFLKIYLMLKPALCLQGQGGALFFNCVGKREIIRVLFLILMSILLLTLNASLCASIPTCNAQKMVFPHL